MKKLLAAILVFMTGIKTAAYCQLKLTPIALSGISSLIPIQLPRVGFTIVRAKTPPSATAGTNAICTGTCSTVLPVTLLELSGYRLNNSQVVLDWKTENGTGSRGFNMERSLDATVTFSLVGTTPSDTSNITQKNYTETDMNSNSQTSYYRVKQIDLDGNYTYSNTISIAGHNPQQKIMLSPNPANTYSLLNCFSTGGGKATVVITSANGQKLNEIPWTLNAGNSTLQLPLQGYAAGFYYVQTMLPDGNRQVVKLVVR